MTTGEPKLKMHCPKCARPLVLRHRRADGTPFLGCSGWPLECKHTEPLPEAIRMRLAGAPTLPGLE